MHQANAPKLIRAGVASLCLAATMPAAAQLAPQYVTHEAALEALATNADQTLEVIREWQQTRFDGADCNGYEALHAALMSLDAFYQEWFAAPLEDEVQALNMKVHSRHFFYMLSDDPQDEIQQLINDDGRAWLIQQRCEYLRLVEESGLIEAIDEALQCRYYHPEQELLVAEFQKLGLVTVPFGPITSAFREVAWHALLRSLAANDPENAADWTRRWIDLGATRATQGETLHHLTAAGDIAAFSASLRRAIVSYDINPETLGAVARAMDEARPMPTPSDLAPFKRLIVDRFVYWPINSGHHYYEERHPGNELLKHFMFPTPEELAAVTAELRLATEALILYDQSTGPARALADAMREPLIEQLQAKPKWHIKGLHFYRDSAIRDLERPSIVTASSAASTRLAGIRLMVAIEWMRADTGRLPESLDDLIPKYAQTVTGCNFAADGRFRYRLLDPDATKPGTGYLLYSVAPDGLDNGGHSDEEMVAIDGRILKVSVQEATGLDWVVNSVEPYVFLPQDAAACRVQP